MSNSKSNSRLHFESEKKMLKCKRSQVTIFVIIALVIVAAIVLFFVVKNNGLNPNISPGDNPQGYMDDCINKALISAESRIIKNNGFLNVTNNYLNFNNSKVPYYCFAFTELTLCTNKHPALANEISKQIYNDVKPKIEKCFSEVKEEWKNYNYKEGVLNLTIDILPKRIQASVKKEISYVKNEQKTILDNFDHSINSPLFSFVVLSNEIINQEITCRCGEESCNADLIKLSIANRDFEISKPSFEKYDEIYSIMEILSGKQINFAVRNCYKNTQS